MRNIMSRVLGRAGLWLALGFLLAGCTGLPPALLPPTSIPTRAAGTKTRPAPSETSLPTADLAGAAKPTRKPAVKTSTPTVEPTITETPFASKATIKIAIHLPLTGDSAAAGASLFNAARLAVRQLQTPLNQLGYRVELAAFDDAHDVETGVKNANQLAADPAILCGVGNYNYNVMLQAEDIYHQAGLAFISPAINAPAITEKKYLEINRLNGRTDGEGIAAALFAKDKGFKTVYIVSVSATDGKKNASAFLNEASEIGLKKVGYSISNLSEGFTSVLTQVMFYNPDVIYFPGSAAQLGGFIREARTAGYKGAFITSENANYAGFADLAGPLALEDGGTYFTTASAPVSAYPGTAQFLADYQKAYGAKSPALPASAQAYDAVGVCLKAIETAAAANQGDLPTRKQVANAVRALQEYPGITGAYSFNLRGDPLQVNYFVYQLVSSDPKKWNLNKLVGTYRTAPPL